VLFTFPSRYWFTIGRRGVFSLGSWSTQLPTGFHVPRGTRETSQRSHQPFAYGAFTLYGGSFQSPSAKLVISNSPTRPQPSPVKPRNPMQATLAGLTPARFGLFRVRSPLLTESLLFSLPGGTEMVHFPPFASSELCIHSAMTGYGPAGLPHSDIPGSKPVCGSPRLFAAYRVLLRLSAPRHPPCTLSSLTKLEYLYTRRILSLLTLFSCQ
jgi:hypothetical protein